MNTKLVIVAGVSFVAGATAMLVTIRLAMNQLNKAMVEEAVDVKPAE